MIERVAASSCGSGWVAGVDGCRGGWIVALRPLAAPQPLSITVVSDFAAVLALPEQPLVIAVDMPIGLPAITGPGGRAADVAARACLGARQSSVFAVPSRAAIMAQDYREACRIALTTSEPPRKVAKQTFNLFGKIREIDALMSPALQRRVKEVHPEVAFWALNGGQPLGEPKKVKSRPYPPGLALRLGLLCGAGYPDDLLARLPKGVGAGADDLLDAAANSWSAARIATGTAQRFPAEPARDERGLDMEIWG